MSNKYFYRARVSERKFLLILRLFCQDLSATQIAHLSGLSRNSINKILTAIRKRIAHWCELESPFSGEVEVDESWFGAKRKRGKRGRGAFGKTIVFGIYKRNGKVYTEVVPNCSRQTLLAVIQGKVSFNSVIYSDGWRAYHGLVDLGYRKHYRIDHSANEFADGKNHINGIEGFWGFAKTRLSKFKGMHPSTFYLHLKETEFRYNYRHEDLFTKLKGLFLIQPLKLS